MKYATHKNLNRKASVEQLEDRRLMSSVQLIDGMLVLQGNANGNNRISVSPDDNGTTLLARVNNASEHYLLKDVKTIRIIGGEKADNIVIDSVIRQSAFIRGGAGRDMIVCGSGNDTVFAGNGGDTVVGGAGDDLLIGNAGPDKIDAGNGDDPRLIAPQTGREYDVVIKSFTLIDAETNQRIGTLGDGAVLNLAKLPRLNVVANSSSAAATGSIAFAYDGHLIRYENQQPFALAADTAGDFNRWTPSLGGHTLSAVPYSKANGGGNVGTSRMVRFTVIDDPSRPAFKSGNTGSTGGARQHGNKKPANDQKPTDNNDKKPTDNDEKKPTDNDEKKPTDNNNQAGAPNAVIELLQTSVPAGHAIHVNALKTNLKSGDLLSATFDWDFGDSGSKYNTLSGFNAAHAYDKPGDYTIKLTVTNSAGKSSTVTQKVTVTAAQRRVIYVSPGGNDANNGSSKSAAVKTFARAADLVDDNTEILFERGETFNVTSGMSLGKKNVVVGAYGSGAKPVLKWTGGLDYGAIFSTMGGQNVLVRDLAFDSKHHIESSGYNDAVRAGGANITVRDCSFIKVGYAINTNGHPDGVLVQDNSDTSASSIRDYFAWVQGADHVYLGNKVRDAIHSHVLRVGGADRVLVANNDFTNLSSTYGIRGTLTLHKANYLYVTGNKLTDSALGIGPLDGNGNVSGKADRTKWVVIEKNTLHDSQINVGHGTEHVAVRENVIFKDDGIGIDVKGYSDQYDRGVVDLYVVHNTVINNGTSGKFIKVGGDVNGITMTNNLYVAPNYETGTSIAGPVQVLDTNLESFREISNNIWPMPTIGSYASGGINYVGTTGDSSGYKTPQEWEAFVQVKNDQFKDVTLSSSYLITLNGVEAGAHLKKAA